MHSANSDSTINRNGERQGWRHIVFQVEIVDEKKLSKSTLKRNNDESTS